MAGTPKQALKRKRDEGQKDKVAAEDSARLRDGEASGRRHGKAAGVPRVSSENQGRMEVNVHQYASYMRRRILEIQARILERGKKVELLREKALRGELASLLECEGGPGNNAPFGIHGVSVAQHIRLERQAMETSRFYEELMKWDRKGVDAAKEALAEAYEGGNLTENASGALLEGRRRIGEHRKDSYVSSIAEEVASSSGCNVASSTILAWFRRYDRSGKFASDGRGKHERDWILHEKGSLDRFVAFIKGEKCVKVKEVTDFVNEKLLSRGRRGLVRTASGAAVGLEGPVSHTTVHQWMMRVGFEYDRASQSFNLVGGSGSGNPDLPGEAAGEAWDAGVA